MSEKKFSDIVEHDENGRDIEGIIGEPEKIDKEEWRYACSKHRSIIVEGKEMAMAADEKGEQVYGGKFVRDLIESRKYRKKSYTWLGYIESPKRGAREVGLPHNSLFKHTAIFGNSGYGKSTVIKNMLLQWAQSNYGFCFVDPKGDDSRQILRTIPEHRMDDIIWVEPGATDRETVGFNILSTGAEPGTDEQRSEANAIVNDVLGLLEAKCRNWSPQIEGVVSAILDKMLKDTKNYTIGDLYKIANSASEREVFVEMYDEELDKMEKEYIENIEQGDLNEIVSALKEFLSKPIIKETIAEPESNITISEAIEEDKIILANFSNIADEDLEFITAALVRRIWSKIKSRKDIPEPEREPYFLAIDEFDNVTKDFEQDEEDLLRVAEILSTARSYRLSCLVANQNPTQLAEDIKNDVYGNCNNLFTFNQGNFQDASDLANPIEDVDSRQIMSLSEFKLIGRLTIDGSKTPGLIINTFAEYPPLRTEQEAIELVEESCKKYGISESKEFDDDDYGVIRFQDETENTNTITINDMVVETDNVLSIIKSGQKNPETDTKLMDHEISEMFAPHIDSQKYYDDLKSNIIIPHIGEEIEELNEEKTYYRLTDKGEKRLSEELGDMTLKAHNILSRKGYYSSIPFKMSTDEFFQYDLIAHPPIQPVKQAKTFEKAKKLNDYFKESFNEIYEDFQDKRLLVVYSDSPKNELKKISEAISNTRERSKCIILCNNKKEAQDLKTIINKDNMRKSETELYNTSYSMSLEKDKQPVSKGDVFWKKEEDNLKIELNGEEYVYTEEEIKQGIRMEDVQYYAQEKDDIIQIIEKVEGETRVIKEFDTFDELEKSEYSVIKKPFIPSNHIIQDVPKERWKTAYIEEDDLKVL